MEAQEREVAIPLSLWESLVLPLRSLRHLIRGYARRAYPTVRIIDLESLVAREGVTVLLTTHNLTEAEKLCAQVGVIRQGKLLTVGNPDELRLRTGGTQAEIVGHGFNDQTLAVLRERPEVANVELHNSHLTIELRGESKIGPLVSLIVRGGGEVEEVRRGKASLEDVFLTLMEEENT